MIALIHVVFGFTSLLTGISVLFRAKGTRFHVLVGRTYVISMIGLNLTAFGIYTLFGTWGIFHWTAVMSLLTLLAGLFVILNRRKYRTAVTMHYYFMLWSYVGLLAATSNEVFVNIPFFNQLAGQYSSLPLISIGVIITVGCVCIPLFEKRFIRKLAHARKASS